jgi:hypothetical protein
MLINPSIAPKLNSTVPVKHPVYSILCLIAWEEMVEIIQNFLEVNIDEVFLLSVVIDRPVYYFHNLYSFIN